MHDSAQFLSQGVDYLGFLDSKLRDLRGYGALANEFLQNADDASATLVTFDFQSEALVIENNSAFEDCGHMEEAECPWRSSELNRRCDFHSFRLVAGRDKRNREEAIGAFGVGFISAYQVTDEPELISGRRHWVIRPDRDVDQRIEQKSATPSDTTVFRLPWAFNGETTLRKALRVEPVNEEGIGRFRQELENALPSAVLFLRHIECVQVRVNGVIRRSITRLKEGEQLLVEDGSKTALWQLLHGSFESEALQLRAHSEGRIEAKRKAGVTIAVPANVSDLNGLLCAYLPTEHETGLPFHINADFFPSSDRKRILLDSGDYQEKWNKEAIKAAAHTLAEYLLPVRDLLGHKGIWTALQKIHQVALEAEGNERNEAFGEFWRAVRPRLRELDLVKATTGQWKKPREVFLLGTFEEESVLSLLESAGLAIVHPELRSAYNLLTSSEVGVPVLRLSNLATALATGGLNHRLGMDSSPAWMRVTASREKLGLEIELLLAQRLAPVDRAKAMQQTCACAIAIASNGDVAPPQELKRAPESTVKVFEPYGLLPLFLGPTNPRGIAELVLEFGLKDGISALENVPAGTVQRVWEETPESVRRLIGWFADHRAELREDQGLAIRLKELPIWPSGSAIRPLAELAVPGNFADPLRLARIVELDVLQEFRDFLIDMGAEIFTISTYVMSQVPLAFAGKNAPSPEIRRKLLQVVAARIGELQGVAGVRDALVSCPLVECQDGIFRSPQEVYFDSDIVRKTLGPTAPRAVLPREHLEPVTHVLKWLGVAEGPRPKDILKRIRELAQLPPDGASRHEVQNVFAYVGRLWRDEAAELKYGPALEDLKSLAWLPARNEVDTWYRPHELYAIYSSYLFETQARFLDVAQPEQSQARAFIGFLGVLMEPSTAQVVNHLLDCAKGKREVNSAVYAWLNQKAEDPAVLRLRDTPCLLLQNVGYKRPDQVYWDEHPFGPFRFQLPSDHRIYTPLFERLDVREAPDSRDAIRVLQEISDQYGVTNQALGPVTSGVVMQCWMLLERHLRDGELDIAALSKLTSLKAVVDDRGILERPDRMFFDDSPGLASKFKDLIQHNVMTRRLGAWRAMEAAGVHPLSRAVKVALVECEGAVEAKELGDRLRQRRALIARIVEANRADGDGGWNASILETLRIEQASRLEVTHTLKTFNRSRTTEPEAVPVYYNHEEGVLYFLGEGPRPWAAIARELSHALNPDAEAAKVASGLKDVLSAESLDQASLNLDELGYPPLEASVTSIGTSEPVGLGGVSPASTEEHTAQHPATVGGGRVTTPEGALRSMGIRGEPTTLPPELERSEVGLSGSGLNAGGRAGGNGQLNRKRSRLRTYVAPDDGEAGEGLDDEKHSHISALEKAGVARVLDFERKARRTPVEMPQKHPGYDIESRNDVGEIERFIEVKSVAGDWDLLGAGLSRKQFECATELKTKYWLYVVERAEQSDYRIYRIQDPARKVGQFFYDDGWVGLAEPDEPFQSVDQGQ